MCVLTHDPKFDVPVLEVALRLPEVAYIGAMGSRRTHDDRLKRLQEAGLTDAELARLSSPIGLDLGARTPEETAVSIAAEIIALRWGGDGEPADGDRRAHPPHPAERPASGTVACNGRATRGRLASEGHGTSFGERRRPWSVSTSTSTGCSYSDDVEPRTLLVQYLREQIGKTGTVVGCDTSNCGACTVHLDGTQREVLHDVRGPGRRARGHHHRGPRHGRRAAPDAAGLPREPRAPVRLLHPGHDHAEHRPAEGQPEPRRGRGP